MYITNENRAADGEEQRDQQDEPDTHDERHFGRKESVLWRKLIKLFATIMCCMNAL